MYIINYIIHFGFDARVITGRPITYAITGSQPMSSVIYSRSNRWRNPVRPVNADFIVRPWSACDVFELGVSLFY